MLKNEINEIINEYDTDVAVLVKNLNTNEILYSCNEKKVYSSADIIKIPIMIESLIQADDLIIPLLREIKIKDSDKVDFSIITEQNLHKCTYLDLITWMIIGSDNTAANVLIDLIGMTKINDRIKNLGMKNTSLQRKMMNFEVINNSKNNVTTLEDMLIIMEGLYGEKVINKEIARKAINIMKNQRDNTLLKRYICDNVILANITEKLDNQYKDVGIFYTKAADYFIGIFINNADKNKKSYETIGNISKRVYEYFMDNL